MESRNNYLRVIAAAFLISYKGVGQMQDVIIIGAGITGCAAAYTLSRYQLKVLVVEQGPDVAMATSRANSGIIHAGYDPQPGTLMADLNVQGNAMYPSLCRKLGVPFWRNGSLVVAREGEEEQLRELLHRGRANGVPDLVILGRDEVLNREPNLSQDVVAALYAPSAGLISPWETTLAFAEVAAANGVTFMFNTRVTGVLTEGDSILGLETSAGKLGARVVINATGVHADLLARLAGAERYDIFPRKGEYLLLDKELDGWVRHTVFPLPTPKSKGILVLPTVDGNILAGPTAVDVQDREDISTTREGLAQVRAGALALFPDLPLHRAITSFAGLRAVPGDGDFVIRSSARIQGWIDAGGIQSPGLTAAPAIGEKLAGLVAGLIPCEYKQEYRDSRTVLRLRDLPLLERERWIQRNPLYGRIICRCEGVSEGEIVDALHSPVPATTLDGIKQRTRAGGGRCQGGFCQPRLLTIMARELGIAVQEVTKSGHGSPMVVGRLDKGGAEDEN
jgi:glycerol-3-phosphate dehydrogenase